MDSKLLQEIGLTDGETKVYLALLKLGETKTGQLSKDARVSSSKVYKILDRLIVKGLAGFIVKGKIKYFNAMEPKRILDYIDEKQGELSNKRLLLEKLIPQLENKKYNKTASASIYEGFKAVTNLFRNTVEELNSGESYFVIGGGYGEGGEKLRRFFYKHHQRRTQKGVVVKMLANYDEKNTLVKTTVKNSEIRFLPQYLITNMEIVFYRNKVFIVLWTKEMIAFFIESEEAVKSFKAYFNAFWKIAKE